jgi:transposase
MYDNFVGIDISKYFFDASVEVSGKLRHHQFPSTEKGFEALLKWCQKWQVGSAHFCMEATGAFWVEIATTLHEAGFAVSVVNPACIKRFAQSELKRTKTDKVDAGIISRFCRAMSPALWQPISAELQQLQKLVRRVLDLTKIRQQEKNRRSSKSLDGVTLESVERTLKFIEAEIVKLKGQIERLYKKYPQLQHKRELLLSIPGVGPETANTVISEVPCIEMFSSAKQLVAYAGLAPKEITSGSSIRGRTRISKTGRSRLRTVLYLPSVSARKYNPIIHAFCDRLLKNGKAPMKVVGAAMRKLLHIIFGVLKSGKPFSTDFIVA